MGQIKMRKRLRRRWGCKNVTNTVTHYLFQVVSSKKSRRQKKAALKAEEDQLYQVTTPHCLPYSLQGEQN